MPGCNCNPVRHLPVALPPATREASSARCRPDAGNASDQDDEQARFWFIVST